MEINVLKKKKQQQQQLPTNSFLTLAQPLFKAHTHAYNDYQGRGTGPWEINIYDENVMTKPIIFYSEYILVIKRNEVLTSYKVNAEVMLSQISQIKKRTQFFYV